ncbi:NUDIX hydrolase [Intrasporangium sp.]|uniref:NUDIX hydrolase n=1 Tax=Intrasporangium sp. TaxID=1925024 RepID=UPI00293A49C1|nr:NUDIX domain-containing protein [Intrasporangium sp.]MDV3221355.1 NUDIX domain-containing protein [Intrasporangium sp.]
MRTNVPGGIRVLGQAVDGSHVEAGRLAHGQHPEALLATHGWLVESATTAEYAMDGALELTYVVSPLSGIRPEQSVVPRDPDVAPGEVGDPFQRAAAYAIVTSRHGLLLTQFNEQTHVAGDWGLPGGGLDEGESPVDGVHREVWEETGQRIALGHLVEVQSSHWVGRAPNGVVENFHAIRIVYRATCPEPRDIVIHDVGGTTADARWVPVDRLRDVPLSSAWHHLPELLIDRQ